MAAPTVVPTPSRPVLPASAAIAGIRPAVGPAASGAAVAVAVLARLGATGDPRDFLWAEDGAIFLGNAGDPSSLLQAYAGYAHLLPRLVALPGVLVPVDLWSTYAVLVAAAVVGVLAAFVHAAARALTESSSVAVLAAASLALTPALALESLGSLANLQWYLLPAALWALLLPSGSLRRTGAAVAFAAAASTPLVVLLAPAAVLVHRRDVWAHRAVAGAAAGLFVQLLSLLFGGSAPGGPQRDFGLPDGVGTTVLTHLGGTVEDWTVPAWASLLAVTGLLLLGTLHNGPLVVHQWAAVLSGGLLLTTTTLISGEAASRYVGSASMLVLAGVAIAAGGSRRAWPLLAVLATAVVLTFPAHPLKFLGPTWPEEVAQWSVRCATPGAPGGIPVSPPGWGVAEVPCPRS